MPAKKQQPKQQGPSRSVKQRRPSKPKSAAVTAAALAQSSIGTNAAANPMLATVAGSSSDPFRLPDSVLEESVPLVLSNEYTITSDAAGYACWGEGYALAAAKATWTVTAGVTGAATYTAHPDVTTYTAAFPWSRELMYRIHVEYIGADLNAAGRLYCLNSLVLSTLDTQTLANVYDDANYTGKAIDGYYDTVLFNQSPRYEASGGSSYMGATFPARIMFCAGLPASTVCFRVRIERYLEGLPGRDSLHRGSTAVELLDTPMMEVLTNASHPGLHGGAMTKKSEIVANVWKAVRAGASAAWHHRTELGAMAGRYASSRAAKGALLALTAM